MANYPIANIGVGTAFTKDVNHIASIRTQLKSALTGIIHLDEEAVIEKVIMKSASTFSVQFYGNVTLTATLVDSEYVLEYKGIIDRIVFKNNNTTLTFFQVGWSQMKSCHISVGISTTPSTTFAINSPTGAPLIADANGKFDLISGTGYVVRTEATADYDADKFYITPDVTGDINRKLDDIKKYHIVFVLTPTTASVVVKDSSNNVVKPEGKNKYILKDSTVAGIYSYEVTKSGYITATGTIDAQADASISVTIKQLSSIAITTPPTKTAYEPGDTFDATGMVVTATYSDSTTAVVTDYTYSPTTPLTTEDTSVTVSFAQAGITKTATQSITVVEEPCLTFTAPEQFSMSVASPKWNGTMEYSVGTGEWTTWDGTSITSDVKSDVQTIRLRGTGNTSVSATNATPYATSPLVISGSNVSCNGNIETLQDYNTVYQGNHPSMNDNCYMSLFDGCASLISAPTLPATTSLMSRCYYYMFRNCTSLTTTPALPATTLRGECYYYMFKGCTSLTTTPTLPATTLAAKCYQGMFEGCTSLTTAPALPATTLTYNCYQSMFKGCTSLATTPALPATTLIDNCYQGMFEGCTSLTTAPALPATTLADGCYGSMLKGCTSLTTSPALPATTLASGCYNSMLYGCSNIKVSTEQDGTYQYAWRIPTSGTGIDATFWNTDMLKSTGGTFTSNPVINTTYYTDHQPVSA